MRVTQIYFVNIITGFLNVLNQLEELLMQNFVLFWVKGWKENGISRDFDSEIYILSLTMETFVALKEVSALLGNCESGNLMW